ANRVLRQSAVLTMIIPPPHRGMPARLVDLLRTSHPDLTRRLWSRAMIRSIRRALRETTFDVVQVEGLEMLPLWLAAQTACRARPRVILDEHNAEYRLQASVAAASRANGAWRGAIYSSIQAARLER